MAATYIRCAAERHFARESMGTLMQATLPDCREALLSRYAGTVQCVYLDPPFYTGKCFDMKARIGEKGYRTGSPALTLLAVRGLRLNLAGVWALSMAEFALRFFLLYPRFVRGRWKKNGNK